MVKLILSGGILVKRGWTSRHRGFGSRRTTITRPVVFHRTTRPGVDKGKQKPPFPSG